ncbi:MAG TPA: DUF4034 domain-containing protein [Acidobacteriaceae bacterium]|nr:DUF4034 domain-containing protein [Acidobacteriaceae bacterium]
MRRMSWAGLVVLTGLFAVQMPAQSGQSGVTSGERANNAMQPLLPGEEQPAPESRWVRTIRTDLIEGRYAELDAMADQYRASKARALSGAWRLRQFYSVLDQPAQSDKDFVDHIEHLRQWMETRPNSITARVALATSLHRWAWVARGSGYAATVTPEGWKLFNERVNEARVVLEGSANMQPMCPQWFSEMMTVSLALNWDADKERDIFERGIRFEPEYFYLYQQYANYLLPKWDGEPGQASAFAKDSADKLGGEEGDIVYYHVATVLISRHNKNFPLQEMDWKRIRNGGEAILAKYGQSRTVANWLAYLAYQYRDAAEAQKEFALIGDEWGRGVWIQRNYFNQARDWAQGRTQWPSTNTGEASRP